MNANAAVARNHISFQRISGAIGVSTNDRSQCAIGNDNAGEVVPHVRRAINPGTDVMTLNHIIVSTISQHHHAAQRVTADHVAI